MSVKARLTFFQQNIGYGACERYFATLLQKVDRSRFDVGLICPDHPDLQPLFDLEQTGVEVRRYSPALLASDSLKAIMRFRNLFCKTLPDLVHFNDPCVAGILAAKLARVPILIMTHHTPELTRRYNWRGLFLERIAFGCQPFVIFTSENDRRTGIIKDGVWEDRSVVIPLAIDPRVFAQHFDRDETCRELGIPREHQVVGNIARLSEQKGHTFLIGAARLVLSQHSRVIFLIVGDGELRESLASQVERAGIKRNFVFTGHRKDVARLLSVVDVFVMPSLFEGLCVAVLEAFAAAKPVVATRVGGIPSTIVDGETGILVLPRDSEALAEAILWMLDHPEKAREMGLNGKRRIETSFTEEIMVSRTQALYGRLLSARRQ